MIQISTLIAAAQKASASRHYADFRLHPRGLQLMMNAKAKDGETCHYTQIFPWESVDEGVVDRALEVGDRTLNEAIIARAKAKPGSDLDFDNRMARWNEHMTRFAAVHREQPNGQILIELERMESWPRLMGGLADVLDPPETW